MNQIMPFAFGDNLVRTILDEKHEPWFVAKDVALALGYYWPVEPVGKKARADRQAWPAWAKDNGYRT